MSKYAVRKLYRSGTQECPLCGLTSRLVEHHNNGRNIPRCNEPWNTVFICPTCHDEIHMGDIMIYEWVHMGTGRELMWERLHNR